MSVRPPKFQKLFLTHLQKRSNGYIRLASPGRNPASHLSNQEPQMLYAFRFSLLLIALAATSHGADPIPPGLTGQWLDTSVSATSYWNENGTFAGNGFGTAQFFDLRPDGTYKQYLYIQTTSYNIRTEMYVTMEGRYVVSGDQLAFTPGKGRFLTTGSRTMDRDMTEKELTERAKSYKFSLGQDNGQPQLSFHFDDGSAFRFKPSELPKKKS
jgi:hypothetical protein